MSAILQQFRKSCPPRYSGLVVSPELRRLSEQPGYVGLDRGGQRMRDLYTSGSLSFEPFLLSDFGLACFLGLFDVVKQMVENGTAPDICGTETAYRHGYLTLVVSGRTRIQQTPFPARHADVARFLIKSGVPIEQEDIVGYTPLGHAALRDGPQLDVARVLLEEGADPNHRNKYGCVAVLEASLAGSVKSIDLLLEFGADTTIPDADGCKASVFHLSAGPQVSAVFMKWERKRSGVTAAFEDKSCDNCGTKPTTGVSLRLCARCRTARYCSTECQRTHWRIHKPNCRPFEKDNTLKLVPYYEPSIDIFSQSSLIRNHMGMKQPETTGPQSSTAGKWPSKRDLPKKMVVKVQIPYAGPSASSEVQSAMERAGSCLVYNKRRDFVCQIRLQENGKAYEELVNVIKVRGVAGAKAYFAAEMRNKDELIVKAGDVLAEQSF